MSDNRSTEKRMYRVLLETDAACKQCLHGAMWTIVWEEDGEEIGIGTSWGDEELANDICDLMNTAYEAGQEDMVNNAEEEKLVAFFRSPAGDKLGRDGDHDNYHCPDCGHLVRTSNERSLLPCPFCYSPRVKMCQSQFGEFNVECESCITEGPEAPNAEVAADRWNHALRRGAAETSDELAKIDELLQTMIVGAQVYTEADGTITGYKIKTGALHRLLGLRPNLWIPQNLPPAVSREIQKAYDAFVAANPNACICRSHHGDGTEPTCPYAPEKSSENPAPATPLPSESGAVLDGSDVAGAGPIWRRP